MIAKGAQIRAGRALLGWTRADLANTAGLHRNAVAYWERHDVIPTAMIPYAVKRMAAALLEAGVKPVMSPAAGVRLVRGDQIPRTTRSPAPARHGVSHGATAGPRHVGARHGVQDAAARPKAARSTADREEAPRCGARTRRGTACVRKGLANGRCPNHGGKSTGPKTAEGRARIAARQRLRWQQWRAARAR